MPISHGASCLPVFYIILLCCFSSTSITFWIMPPTSMPHLPCLLLLILLCALTAQQTAQPSPIKNCGNMSKQAFREMAQNYANNPQVEKSIESAFPLDKYKLIDGLLTKNTTLVTESIKQNEAMYVLNFGLLLLFFLLLLLLVPALLCTKCCDCCCSRQMDQPYSSCQIRCPAVCLIVLVLALIGLCIAVIFINANYEHKFNDFKCSLSIMADGIINGGSYPQQKIKFMGLNQYLGRVKNFLARVTDTKNDVQSNLGQKSQNMDTLKRYVNALMEEISRIPSPDGSQLSLMYPQPLMSKNPIVLEKSLFPVILGTSDSLNSIIFNLSSSAVFLNRSLEGISDWATNLTSMLKNIDSKEVTAAIKSQIRSMQELDFNIQTTIGIVERGIAKVYIIGSYILLGLTLFISFIISVQQVCLSCCQKYSYRSGLTCCCGLLWVVGLLFFVIAFGFSLGNPGLLYGCQYLREGFGSEQGYNKYIAKFMTKDSWAVTTVGKCLSSSREPRFLYQNISIGRNFNISELSTYPLPPTIDLSQALQGVSSNFTFTIHTTQQYRTARILDVQNPSMIQQIKSVAKTEECFPDKWLPSLHQNPSLIQCQLSTSSDNVTCPNSEAFINRQEGCVGCMDAFLVLERFTNSFELDDELKSRYAQCFASGRSEVVNNLSLLWQNYYKQKKEKIGPVEGRAIKLQASFNQSEAFVHKKIYPKINNAKNWLLTEPVLQESQSWRNQTDEEGLEGVDCRLLGRDIDLSINILCSAGIVYLYDLRYLYTAAAIIIFFICTVATCSISRSYHQARIDSGQALQDSHRDEKQSRPATERKLEADGYFN